MIDTPEESLKPEELRAREALHGLSRPPADSSFRARLKREFASGAIASRARRRPIVGREWRPRLAWAWAPAAAAVAVIGILWLNRGPDWTVASTSGSGVAVVNGRPIPLDSRPELSRALGRGGDLRLSSDSGLELLAEGQMAVEVAPGTEASLSPPSGRWFSRAARAEVRSGEMRFTTGARFHGATLRISTPEAQVLVTGTTVAVIRESVGTCVCVMDGEVRMGSHAGSMGPIESGMRRFMFNDGRPVEEAEMRPVERIALAEMRARYAARLR